MANWPIEDEFITRINELKNDEDSSYYKRSTTFIINDILRKYLKEQKVIVK